MENDTAYRLGDAAGWASLEAHGGETWSELLPRTRLAVGTLHRLPLSTPSRSPASASTPARTVASRACGCTAA